MTAKSKYLHHITIDGIGIRTRLRYNTNTNHILIDNTFNNQKRPINKKSATYFGVTVAEKVLSNVFKNVERMPANNSGYDFICGKGYKVDSKASCKRIYNKRSNNWSFHIDKNKTANYFALLAFDNRDDINPLYFWLIPGNVINDKVSIGISESTINKWDEYRRDISKIISCCNTLKGE